MSVPFDMAAFDSNLFTSLQKEQNPRLFSVSKKNLDAFVCQVLPVADRQAPLVLLLAWLLDLWQLPSVHSFCQQTVSSAEDKVFLVRNPGFIGQRIFLH